MKYALGFLLLLYSTSAFSQSDSAVMENLGRETTLSEVVVRKGLDVTSFLLRVRNDTTFYKAFRNLRVLNFTSLNDIKILDKKGSIKASLSSKTRQTRRNGCRTMKVLEEKSTGDMYEDGQLNYYTAELYAGLCSYS